MGKTRSLALFLVCSALLASTAALAFDVQVNTGDFTGFWDIDLSNDYQTGPALVTGLSAGFHIIRTGYSSPQVTFEVLPTGEVAMPAAFTGSAIGGFESPGVGKLDLITVPVTFDPGSYTGGWGIQGVRDHLLAGGFPNSGVETVQLVPSQRFDGTALGNPYLATVGHNGSIYILEVRSDGTLNVRSGSFATADVIDPASPGFDPGSGDRTLRFRNQTISITDRDGANFSVGLNGVTGPPLPPTSNVVLVPGARYLITIRDVSVFSVAYPCAIETDEAGSYVITNDGLQDWQYDISCGVSDLDSDGVPDVTDNCLLQPNPDQIDLDQDGQGDLCDPDDDGDGIDDVTDNCPVDPNPDQADSDDDGQGDVCDNTADDDGDGVVNENDLCPMSPAVVVDADGCSGAQRIARLCRLEDYVIHGQYVSCVAHEANRAADDGLIAPNDKAKFVREAAKNR